MAKDKYNDEDLLNYYSKIYDEIDNESQNDPFGAYVFARVKGGQKTVANKTQSEIRNFDMSFLDTIESVYPALTKIMRDPKKSIRYEQEVVAVEKAKKVDSDTVRHLSSHTQLIKEITKDGDVIPSKVQTTFAEEELAIYENRFIKSLVKRIEMFLERRYEVMKVSLESFETERLNVQNEFLMSGQKVTVGLDIQIKNDLSVNVETTKEQYNRLLYIRELIQSLKGTEFMRALAKARDVVPPIMKTNIIMHNPDFKLCYGLWLYLDRVDGISTNIDVNEKTLKYSPAFDKDINTCMALALTAFIKNRNISDIHASKRLPQIKAPKPIRDDNLELELNLDADNKKLEDYTMNELLLSQTAKFFEASLDGMQQTGNTYNESIRVVYRQMLDMLDQIYPKAFGVSDDELDSKSYYEQLEYARRRMMIFKIVRQAKQMNIARMAKEEKRIEKLISKLEDKIKLQEQKERERIEKERIRDEQERINQLEKERQLQEKKRKLEREAVEKQKKLDKEALLNEEAMLERNQERDKKNAILKPYIDKRIQALKDIRARDLKKPVSLEESSIPIRHRDEYDDLSNNELEALMAENDLLAEKPVEEKKPTDDAQKQQPKKKKAPQKKKKEAPKNVEDKSLEELTDEELEALLAQNQIDDLGDLDDINISSNDEKEASEANKIEPKAINDISELSDEELEKLMNESENSVPSIDDEIAKMSDEELEALILNNNISSIDSNDVDLNNDNNLNDIDTSTDTKSNENEALDQALSSNVDSSQLSDTTDKELEDLSDEELEALMNANGLFDDGDNN